MKNYPYYAIETIGYGKRKRYYIKQVISANANIPFDGKVYKSEERARSAATNANIEIVACGDLWQIMK